jgi:hypothetical protein
LRLVRYVTRHGRSRESTQGRSHEQTHDDEPHQFLQEKSAALHVSTSPNNHASVARFLLGIIESFGTTYIWHRSGTDLGALRDLWQGNDMMILKKKGIGMVSLKALALAFLLTPVTIVAPPLATPAFAQFRIYLPGIRFGFGGRHHRYHGGGRHYASAHHHHHRSRGGDDSDDSGPSEASSASTPGKGVRGTTD